MSGPELDLSALFEAAPIHTDTAGIHRDDAGREHLATDGELTFVPAPIP